jgi:hypothetical protein
MTSPDGSKHDQAKERWDLLPTEAVRQVVKVLGYGARVYAVDNWKVVPDARRRYYAAALRHLTAWWEGEKVDNESGLPHLAHAACCVLFLLVVGDAVALPLVPRNGVSQHGDGPQCGHCGQVNGFHTSSCPNYQVHEDGGGR